eukprot:TRINITY_DN41059_c0_g1_i1.p1 TRINITY_DN41059_c0_g1~~TRINITY_DN41059_c0_g1_i1.p1  ORF type:complete len:493 (-),score=82.22 TRINITY_DN41059_c0_g1_i1:56-1534(-)
MLSVLSSGTMCLTEELGHARRVTHRLQFENTQLLDQINTKKNHLTRHIESIWRSVAMQQDSILLRMAFVGLQTGRRYTQTWRRRPASSETGAQVSQRSSAWLWLWRRKLFSLWRRAAHVIQREEVRHSQEQRESDHSAKVRCLEINMDALLKQVQELSAELTRERTHSDELEETLEEARAQIGDLQRTLKASYVLQFEVTQQHQDLDSRVSALLKDLQQLRADRQAMEDKMSRSDKELARAQALCDEREMRIVNTSEKLSLAEEIIDDIVSSKCVGLQRFFEHYNLPLVVVSLFRRTIEMQAQLRIKSCSATPGSPTRANDISAGSPTRAGNVGSSFLSGCDAGESYSPRPGLSVGSPGGPSTATTLEAELRQHLGLHGDGLVSRHALQTYVEGFRLTHVSPAMVTQVVLALLGLNLGESTCEMTRFISALLSPPPWEQLDIATSLWGASVSPLAEKARQQRRLTGCVDACAASARRSPRDARRRSPWRRWA